jgi:P4 family phage/plasmid primase-like protien
MGAQVTEAIYGEYAFDYLKKGYSPLPLPKGQKKSPPKGWTGDEGPYMASGADVQAWIEEDPDRNIGLRVPKGVIGIDVDDYNGKGGGQTMLDAIEEFGGIPLLGRLTSRDDAVSGIRFFRIPEEVRLASTFAAAGLGPSVEIIQHHHRYAVAPGSIHPETKKPYRWIPAAGKPTAFPAVTDLPELPQVWIDALQPKVTEKREDVPHDAYDAMPADRKAKSDKYVDRVVEGLIESMTRMKTWPDGHREEIPEGRGPVGWEDGMMAITRRFAEVAKADWNPLGPDDVKGLLAKHGPIGGNMTAGHRWSMFYRAYVGDKIAPQAVPNGLVDEIDLFQDVRDEGGPGKAHEGDPDDDGDDTLWPERSWNQQGHVGRTIQHAGERLYWLADEETWVTYRDTRWVRDASAGPREVRGAMEAAVELEVGNYSDERKKGDDGKEKPGSSPREKFLTAMSDQWGIAMFKAASQSLSLDPERCRIATDFDKDPYLLGVGNGVLDLRTGQLVDGEAEQMISKGTHVKFDPEAEAPLFQRYLETSMPDPAMREYLQAICGYSATGSTIEQAFFVHWGETNNGKSVLLNVMRNLLGEHMGSASSKALVRTKGDKHSVELADLAGPRMLQMSELEEGAHLEEAVIKQITGGDVIAARKIAQSNREWRITGKIHILTNHLPHISPSASNRRRLHLVHWPIEIKRPDLRLEEKLRGELSGILNWLVAGVQLWARRLEETQSSGDGRPTGLVRPHIAQADLDEYLHDEDELGQWLRELTTEEDSWTKSSALYASYKLWKFPRGGKELTQTSFGKKLRERGIEVDKRRDANYFHVGLKAQSVNSVFG